VDSQSWTHSRGLARPVGGGLALTAYVARRQLVHIAAAATSYCTRRRCPGTLRSTVAFALPRCHLCGPRQSVGEIWVSKTPSAAHPAVAQPNPVQSHRGRNRQAALTAGEAPLASSRGASTSVVRAHRMDVWAEMSRDSGNRRLSLQPFLALNFRPDLGLGSAPLWPTVGGGLLAQPAEGRWRA
jgi:hypothetical protein